MRSLFRFKLLSGCVKQFGFLINKMNDQVMGLTDRESTAGGDLLDGKIVVLDNDTAQSLTLCELLEERGYQPVPAWSLYDLKLFLKEKNCLVVFIDLDTIPLDNRTIRDLTQKNPGVYFLCLSSKRFHPELKDAICYHIYACINKPFDPEEIFYWLKSIYENERN